jgi:hypothetical protein
MKQGTPVMVGQRKVGTITDRLFWKNVRGSRHMLRNPKGWAIEAEVFDALVDQADTIEVTDLETNIVYTVDVRTFDMYQRKIRRGEFGPQYVLELEYWKESPLQ